MSDMLLEVKRLVNIAGTIKIKYHYWDT
jgi:hypothetical protein